MRSAARTSAAEESDESDPNLAEFPTARLTLPAQPAADRPEGSAVNDVEYQLLAWLEAGHTIFRPVEGTASAKLEFQDRRTLATRATAAITLDSSIQKVSQPSARASGYTVLRYASNSIYSCQVSRSPTKFN
jgi:hypothetical protein